MLDATKDCSEVFQFQEILQSQMTLNRRIHQNWLKNP